MRLGGELGLFFVGGILGLVVDAGVVQALVGWGHANPYVARVPSFLLAATATWLWNRRTTFSQRSSGQSLGAEWLHWLGIMSVGAGINYGIYAMLLWRFPALHPWPMIPTMAGSAVAALVNFSTARRMLFKRAKSVS